MKTFLILLLLFLSGTIASKGQNLPDKGIPLLENFSPADYQNKGKVWDITSTPNGIIYGAADGGLLEYDGKTWNSFAGSTGFTRSVLAINDSLLYTGSDLDFGRWDRNHHQQFEYTSLYPFREDAYDVSEEFWQIHKLQDNVLFVSSRNIYILRNQQLIKIAAPSSFTGSFKVNEKIYLTDRNQGLFVLEDFSLNNVLDFEDDEVPEISGMYQNDTDLIIVTRDEGLYRFSSGQLSRLDNALSETLSAAKVFSFEQVGSAHVAFGTVLKGLYIADLDGTVIHHMNRHKGLPSNTILSLHYAPDGKLWLGMDYGISSLDLKGNFTTFHDYRGDVGTGYTAILKDDLFYLGTNQGLYRTKWDDLSNNREFFSFELIPETEGQVWTLEIIDDQLFMGHDKGLFIVKENNLELLSNEEGVWTILPYRDALLAGNYNGISIFSKVDDTWLFEKKMDLIVGSCNQLIAENDSVLWVNIPNFGVIRATLDEDLHPVDRLIFPLENFDGHEVFLHDKDAGIHLLTDDHQYAYDEEQSVFIKTGRVESIPHMENLLAGVYLPVALHPEYEFFPLYNGFALRYINPEAAPVLSEKPSLVLRKLEAFNNHDRVMFFPGAQVSKEVNNVLLEVIVPNRQGVLYQFRVEDAGEWSEWQWDNTLELLGLNHGSHTLAARAKKNGVISDELHIDFSVAVPWHLSPYAYAAYFVFIGVVLSLLYRWQRLTLKKQRKEMLIKEQKSLRQQTVKHKEEIMRIEQQRLQQEYDQIKQQLKNKTIELAKKARDGEEKNRLILSLKEKCEKAKHNPALFDSKWREMQRILDSYLEIEDKTFEIQMDELHQEFFRQLKERFPDLSNNDLRLCAYLKIGLNTKEIAELLNIQPSSFYISRSRLRKKLRLRPEENLHSFLNEL